MFSPRKYGGSPVHRSATESACSGPRERRKQGHDGQDEKDSQEHVLDFAIGYLHKLWCLRDVSRALTSHPASPENRKLKNGGKRGRREGPSC